MAKEANPKIWWSTEGAAAKNEDTYKKVAARLARLNPKIQIEKHLIESSLKAGSNTLLGISFRPTLNPQTNDPTLLSALAKAKDAIGQPAFSVGSKLDSSHWALRLSFQETKGIGFREIWRPRLTNRPLRWSAGRPGLNVPSLDAGFSAPLGDDPTLPDFSALHCAVSDKDCNIHIDDMGFVMEVNGEIVVDPDFLYHWVNELLWKTKMKGKVPDWAIDHVNLIVPNSRNRYSRTGISLDLVKSEKVKIAFIGSCGLEGRFNCSGTFNLTATHDFGNP